MARCLAGGRAAGTDLDRTARARGARFGPRRPPRPRPPRRHRRARDPRRRDGAVVVVPRGLQRTARCARSAVGLLPTDESLRALRVGAALARAGGVPLLVLTVLRRSPDPADAAVLAARLAPAFAGEPRGPAAGILRAAIDAAAHADESDPFDRGEPPCLERRARGPRRSCSSATPLTRSCARPRGSACSCSARAPTGRPASCCRVAPRGSVLGGARCPVLLVPRAEVSAPVAATVGR